MEEKVDYYESNLDMAGVITSHNVSLSEDFTSEERKDLKQQLEKYMQRNSQELMMIDMKKFYLQIKGADEASYLYRLL